MACRSKCAIAAVFLLAGPALGQTTQPAVPDDVQWGAATDRLQAAVIVDSAPRPGGTLRVRVALRNTGQAPVALGKREQAFAWFFLAYSPQKMWWTEKAPLPPETVWPEKLAAGQILVTPPLELSGLKLYDYTHRKVLQAAYLTDQKNLPKPVGTVAEHLKAGKLALRSMVCARPADDNTPAVVVRSARHSLTVSAGDKDASATGAVAMMVCVALAAWAVTFGVRAKAAP